MERNWIDQNYEEKLKLRLEEILKEGSQKEKVHEICIRLKSRNDFLYLENVFLICQKFDEYKFSLLIECPSSDVYRVAHYLLMVQRMESVSEIKINGTGFKDYYVSNTVSFLRILPLIEIDQNIYEFLAKNVSEIERLTGESLLSCTRTRRVPDERENILLQVCNTCLFGEVKDIKALTEFRRAYFSRPEFHEKIMQMPFLAFLLFAYYNRLKSEEIANECKRRLKIQYGKTQWKLSAEDMPGALPEDNDILSDIFNAWDMADGLIQLLENIVMHAGSRPDVGEKHKAADGKGLLSIRLHKRPVHKEAHEKLSEDFDDLENKYSQYFRGYENKYNGLHKEGEEDCTELDFLSRYHEKLNEAMKQGYYVEGELIQRYDEIRRRIEKRRTERQRYEYFLEMQVSDLSGEYMCEVFRRNLRKREDRDKDKFDKITVRSFFDPTRTEEGIWDKYFHDMNVVHHYGLQIFASVIVNNDGCFEVRSCDGGMGTVYSTTKVSKERPGQWIPGTRYRILIPLHQQSEKENSMMNYDISYRMKPSEEFELIGPEGAALDDFYVVLNSEAGIWRDAPERIKKLYERIGQLYALGDILVFDVDRIGHMSLEPFCKALILYMAFNVDKKRDINIAVINCETYHFINIIRYFAIYYDKKGMCEWMDHCQIYLSGIDPTEEFLISGKNIQTLLVRTQKLAFSRKIHPVCLSILQKMLEKKAPQYALVPEKDDFEYIPFDLLIRKGQHSIFENNVKTVLCRNIQNVDSGCKVEPTHIRIGTKIHINSFYEAELLFGNSYYTNRFAVLLMKQLLESRRINSKKDLCFVGYETYSVSLLCELQKIYSLENGARCTYVVYENLDEDRINLRYGDRLNNQIQVVLVVPINSTLTTFNKLEASLRKRIKDLQIKAYVGVVQVCHDGSSEIEKRFWSGIDRENRRIFSEKLLPGGQYASYLILLESNWQDPIDCCYCFPQDCLMEVPLIETNKTSVVPMQLMGLLYTPKSHKSGTVPEYRNQGTVESLRDYFYYDHISRGNNHYRYYIRTAHYFQRYYEPGIKSWLEEVGERIRKSKDGSVTSFDIIVSPLHFSSAAFVEAVNEVVFHGTSYLLQIDAAKEFRENVQTKYSDLTALYENLRNSGGNVEINFHYVDDDIVSGGTFRRVKHLIGALFPAKQEEHVTVHVFSNVIVLLNRLSEYSRKDYVDSLEDYHYYINLEISHLRSHDDACYLCSEERRCHYLELSASTNETSYFWGIEKGKYSLKPLNEMRDIWKKVPMIRQKRYFRRMYSVNLINAELKKLGEKKNDAAEVFEVLVRLIARAEEQKPHYRLEYVASYLYVASHPLLVYRKSCREAVFVLLLVIMEHLTVKADVEQLGQRMRVALERMKEDGKGNQVEIQRCRELLRMIGSSKKILSYFSSDPETGAVPIDEIQSVYILLLELMVELKSNYIVREDRIADVIYFYYEKTVLAFGNEDKRTKYEQKKWRGRLNDFKLRFVSLVKKLFSITSDEAKTCHFERMLIEQKEGILDKYRENRDFCEYLEEVLDALYYENTSVYYRALEKLVKFDHIGARELEEYYLENYVNFLKYNGVKDMEGFTRRFKAVADRLGSDDKGEENEGTLYQPYVPYYSKLADDILQLVSAECVQFVIGHDEKELMLNSKNEVAYSGVLKKYDVFAVAKGIGCSPAIAASEPIITNQKITEMRNSLILDTVCFRQNQAIIVYNRSTKENEKEQDHQPYFKAIYLLIQFPESGEFDHKEHIRRVLVFRERMMQKLMQDFSNNVIQGWIERTTIMKQMKKARANTHTSSQNQFDISQPLWNRLDGYFFGSRYYIEENHKKYAGQQDGWLLGLMTNIRIGRINTLLLSNSDFVVMNGVERSKVELDCLREDLDVLRYSYYWDDVVICGQNWKPHDGDSVFPEKIYQKKLEWNKGNVYYQLQDYLEYIIFETVNSAYRYGGKENDGKTKICVYADGKYLYIANKVKEDESEEELVKKKVVNGLRRLGSGISLATIAEYFLRAYENRTIKIRVSDGYYTIGLPIFTEERQA